MIFSCWGSFQREVFWLKLTLYYAQVMTMLTTTVMMMLMLLMFMKSDSYRDGDDVEVDDFIWYIFTIWCKTGGGMNASNWIFTHLKFQKKECIANAPYCICIVMHFLSSDTFCKWNPYCKCTHKKTTRFINAIHVFDTIQVYWEHNKEVMYWHTEWIIECMIKCVTFPVGAALSWIPKTIFTQLSLFCLSHSSLVYTPFTNSVYSQLQ